MSITYLLWRFGSWLVTVVPSKLADMIAGGSGTTVYYVWGARRKIARENFAHVLGKPVNDPAVGRVARKSFANFCRYIVEVMRYPKVPQDVLEKRVIIHETDAFRRAMTGNTPVIIISAHFGNIDYASAVATRRYKPFTLAAESMKPVQLFRYLAGVRAERGVNLVPYDQAPRKILEALTRKEWVGFLIDFGVNNQKDITNTEVMFFGAPTRFPASPAILAQRTGAPILVVHTYVEQDKHIQSMIADPIYVPKELSREQAAQVTMQAVAHNMEQFIREHPDQWYVYRAMWPQPHAVGTELAPLSAVGSNAKI